MIIIIEVVVSLVYIGFILMKFTVVFDDRTNLLLPWRSSYLGSPEDAVHSPAGLWTTGLWGWPSPLRNAGSHTTALHTEPCTELGPPMPMESNTYIL